MVGQLDPRRARDLQERRAIYERRARSIRYGTVRPGSLRHLVQCGYRAVADLRRPGRLVLVVLAAGSAVVAVSGLGWEGRRLVAAAVSVPIVLVVVTLGQFAQQTRKARRRVRSSVKAS